MIVRIGFLRSILTLAGGDCRYALIGVVESGPRVRMRRRRRVLYNFDHVLRTRGSTAELGCCGVAEQSHGRVDRLNELLDLARRRAKQGASSRTRLGKNL